MMVEGDWYFDNGGAVAGPLNFAQLRRMALTSSITSDTMVWRRGETDRQRLDDIVKDAAWPKVPAMGWTSGNRSAWRRFVARYLDLQIHGSIGFFLLFYALNSFVPITAERLYALLDARGGLILAAMAQALVAVPVGALVVGWSSTSLGKWLCGIRICDRDLKPIGATRALERELDVYIRGLCLGIPLLSLISGALSLRRLKRIGTMHWDEYGIVVLARPAGALQGWLFAVAICLALLIVFAIWKTSGL